MIRCTPKDRMGVTLIELLTVVVIVSILAAIAQPVYLNLVTKARAADAISNMQFVRMAAFTYQTEAQAWPTEASSGVIPPGLEAYLPEDFDLVNEYYTLDFDNWGGSPFAVGVSLVTSDTALGLTALDMLASPKWSAGNKYTWVIE